MPKRTKNGLGELSPREFLFVAAYLANGFKAGDAVMSAGYEVKDVRKLGHQVLKRPHVQKVIVKKVREIAEKIGFTTEHALKKLYKALNLAIPDDAIDLPADRIKAGVACIAERNKMLGDYEKVVDDGAESLLDKARNDVDSLKNQKPSIENNE